MKSRFSVYLLSGLLAVCLFFTDCSNNSEEYSRGVGIYPGRISEDFSPVLKPDDQNYRDIARFRAAYNSSSYDYNLTAQLITDGIITDSLPVYISVSTNNGVLPRNEREWLLDHNSVTTYSVEGQDIWINYERFGSGNPPSVTKIALNGSLFFNDKKAGGWKFVCYGSNDGKEWTEIGKSAGSGLPGEERVNPFASRNGGQGSGRRNQAQRRTTNVFSAFLSGPYGNDSTAPRPSFSFGSGFRAPRPQRIINQTFAFDNPVSFKSYKISLSAPCAETWTFGEISFYNGDTWLKMAPSANFRSAWMSSGNSEEWVCVDLGSLSVFDNIKLHWIVKPQKSSVQISDDNINWTDIGEITSSENLMDDIKLPSETRSRYLRILMNDNDPAKKFVLSELEVMGKGGMVPQQKNSTGIKGSVLNLSGGNWKIQRASLVKQDGGIISKSGYTADNWIIATVPGTVLVSYLNAGAIPDPDFGGNQFMISESFFNSDFWYRNEFDVPSSFKNKRIFLNFDGINWKADVFVNGVTAGKIEGGFIRGKFDVTDVVIPGEKNTVAVLIHKNDNIGIIKEQTATSADKNGGVLGADNPTYHASIGWDWIPTIRGRNIGIWNDVFLKASGPVTIEDPFVSTSLNLPDTTEADISVETRLVNNTNKKITGILSGKFGNYVFEKEVTIAPAAGITVKFDPSEFSSLHITDPVLWWPKGYGAPNLYNVSLRFMTDGGLSDETSFKSGIREMNYDESDNILNIYINGRRFIGRGGNWGFPESNLRYRAREYDIAVAYHADMNFTMIRNWVGQTGDDEFFDACDRHGIMVWQDFWLANPADGPNPDNPAMFMKNAEDYVRRIRNHASIGLYCGRNEGNPPVVIDTALRAMIPVLHHGLHYISNSSMGVVSGGGPYRALPVRDYFLLYGYNKFHSERGMPNVMNYESLKQTLPESALWPQNSLWGVHDYCLESAQGAASFNMMIEKAFGKTDNAQKFTELAQWINYNGYRGIFEGRSKFRQGMLLWMSHPAWPSMVWQTYDYYFDPTAAYFGCKKASEPLHIQWNPVYDTIEVVNYSAGIRKGLVAKARLLNMDGSVQWEKETTVDCNEDMTIRCFRLEFPQNLSEVHFIKLTLTDGEKIISENFYWRGKEDGNYQALNKLPKAELSNMTKVKHDGKDWVIKTSLKNTGTTPALMIRLKVIGKESGSRILPVLFSDNYISLMPGEEKVITMRILDEDTRGEKPGIEVSGFNL